MSKIKLAIVFGGESSEYPVSLHSVESVIANLDETKYELFLLGITRDGNWFHYTGTLEGIENDTWHESNCKEAVLSPSKKDHGFYVINEDGTSHLEKIDVIFPVLHGKNGEDGTIQGVFELSGIPYVGCDVMSSSLIMDKEMTHIIAENAGIPMAPYVAVYKRDVSDYGKLFDEVEAKLSTPFFIKPCNAGSSFGIHKVSSKDEFEACMLDAFFHDGRGKLIIETTVEGFELGVAVMGNDDLTVGSVDEIALTIDFFDYEGKYDLKGAEIICPARIDEESFEAARTLAAQAYRALNCRGFARVDMFITPDKKLVFNEANTLPGFTANSRYPSMMKEIGIGFSQLIDSLINLAFEKRGL